MPTTKLTFGDDNVVSATHRNVFFLMPMIFTSNKSVWKSHLTFWKIQEQTNEQIPMKPKRGKTKETLMQMTVGGD